ncbi:MAG: right-handed parallel beta-helix repeat-containing protein [Bacteroidales bacterium]|jgi:parallel beta-helix repeat protein|nr:right-handed parallel beta-helix repeat-containing protein [Bacteroidales bacterium]
MKNYILQIFALLFFANLTFSQQYLPLQDNWEIPSNSWIKIAANDYTFSDFDEDGVIQIVGKENIIIDGDSVTVEGENYFGYMVYIENSNNIIIKNFDAVFNYYYATVVKNSHNIIINDNNFSYNQKDTTGWISIWTGVNQALGGGVLMHQSRVSELFSNLMTQQNDGIAMYECDSIHIHDNVLNWNTGFGVRMNFTDSCNIHHNDCSHVNRLTDPSDCAAILLIVSNENRVEHNDLTYSGDGIFLGQYNYSTIPNNNYFAYNDCSYSPHNAIEATFADGNVYKNNLCNYSHYGFWLGYSFNSIVDSNEIIGNQYSGIAIDRGFNNTFTNNTINENPNGFELWEGDGIPPYQNQFSHDYFIYDNIIEGNTVAISAKETEHLVVRNNQFICNRNGIYLEGLSTDDSITGNLFERSIFYHIENNSQYDIWAIDNNFMVNDEDIIACNIYDVNDNPAKGEVIWHPYIPGDEPVFQKTPPNDLSEPPAVWYAYPESCWWYGLHEPTIIEWDSTDKKVGYASVHISTPNGWDIAATYRPGGDSIASWSFTENDSINIWLKSENYSPYGFQFCHIILGNDCGAYYKYTTSASSILNPTIGSWKNYSIPIAGNSLWSRTSFGNISLDSISYFEFHADTWDVGFELWIDGLQFTPFIFTSIEKPAESSTFSLSQNYPNPFSQSTNIRFNIQEPCFVTLSIFDVQGNEIRKIINEERDSGSYEVEFDGSDLPAGVYFYKLITNKYSITKKFVLIK